MLVSSYGLLVCVWHHVLSLWASQEVWRTPGVHSFPVVELWLNSLDGEQALQSYVIFKHGKEEMVKLM